MTFDRKDPSTATDLWLNRVALATQQGGAQAERARAALQTYWTPILRQRIANQRILDPEWREEILSLCMVEVDQAALRYDPAHNDRDYRQYCYSCLYKGPLRYATEAAAKLHRRSSELSGLLTKVWRHQQQQAPESRETTPERIAEELGLDLDLLKEALDLQQVATPDSLDTPLGEDGKGGALSEQIAAPEPGPESLYQAREECAKSLDACDKALPPWLQPLFELRLRRWLAGQTPLTVDEALRQLTKRTNCTDFRFDLIWRENRIRELLHDALSSSYPPDGGGGVR